MADEGTQIARCQQCGNSVQVADRFCGVCGARVASVTPEDPQVIPEPVAVSQVPSRGNGRTLLLAVTVGLVALLIVGGSAVALLRSNDQERAESSGAGRSQEGDVAPQNHESVAPGLEDAVKEWASDAPRGAYILVPGYLPFDVDGYSNYLDSGSAQYGMYAEYDNGRYGLNIDVIDPNNLSLYERQGTVRIDGRSYYYHERDSCSLFLWETSGGPQAFWLQFLGPLDCTITDEELPKVLSSMVRVKGKEANSALEGAGGSSTGEPTALPSPTPTVRLCHFFLIGGGPA